MLINKGEVFLNLTMLDMAKEHVSNARDVSTLRELLFSMYLNCGTGVGHGQ